MAGHRACMCNIEDDDYSEHYEEIIYDDFNEPCGFVDAITRENISNCTCAPASSASSVEECPCPPPPPATPCPPPPCGPPPYYTPQLRFQDVFWTTTIKQLRNHIDELELELKCTEYSVNSIESTMLPFITYLMIRLSNGRPNLDVNALLAGEISKRDCGSTSSQSLRALQLPSVDVLRGFVIQDNDVLYMDIVKAMAEETAQLQRNMDAIHQQQEALLSTKRQVDGLFRGLSCGIPERLNIDGKLMHNLHDRLRDDNVALAQEIEAEKTRTTELQDQLEVSFAEMAKEEKRIEELTDALNIAGANIEIALAARGGVNFDEEMRKIPKIMERLNDEYTELGTELDRVCREEEEARCAYRKRQFAKHARDCKLDDLLDNDQLVPAQPTKPSCDCYRAAGKK